jgi:hypothetical protein
MREALWDAHERKRLYEEAVCFLRLRAERWRWARKAPENKTIIPSAPAMGTGPAPSPVGNQNPL